MDLLQAFASILKQIQTQHHNLMCNDRYKKDIFPSFFPKGSLSYTQAQLEKFIGLSRSFTWGHKIAQHLNFANVQILVCCSGTENCEFTTSGASPGNLCHQPPHVKGRERPKEEADHFSLAGGSLINKETYLQGLSWAPARWVDLHTHLPEF